MTTTFADYAAAAEARKDIELAVLGHTHALCEALRQNFIDFSIKNSEKLKEESNDDYWKNHYRKQIEELKKGICDYDFTFEIGRKYLKVILIAYESRSVHCFIDKKTGEVYKSASWKSPAKGVRYNLTVPEQRKWLFENADWAGCYLYRR